MNIGQAAQHANLPPKTIRYYEDIALIKPDRAENGYRDYSDADVHRLRATNVEQISGEHKFAVCRHIQQFTAAGLHLVYALHTGLINRIDLNLGEAGSEGVPDYVLITSCVRNQRQRGQGRCDHHEYS